MSSGPILTGNEEHTTFRDLERMKWEGMRDGCPCREYLYYCPLLPGRCSFEKCPMHYWAGYKC